MSTDLEFRRGLPQLRLPTIRIRPSQPAAGADLAAEIQTTPKSHRDSDSGGEECRTPTSPDHKIPAIVSCPPAPRKPRWSAPCKRKLCELEFFEIVAREEVESFFRSSSVADLNSSDLIKRRCPCT